MSIAMKYCLLSGQHFTATVMKYGPSTEQTVVVNVIKLCPLRKIILYSICYLFEFELCMYIIILRDINIKIRMVWVPMRQLYVKVTIN